MSETTYSITPLERDANGYWRGESVRDVEPGEVESLGLGDGDFSAASDLPDGTCSADAEDGDGRNWRVYREVNE